MLANEVRLLSKADVLNVVSPSEKTNVSAELLRLSMIYFRSVVNLMPHLLSYLSIFADRDSSVGLATSYWLDGTGIESW